MKTIWELQSINHESTVPHTGFNNCVHDQLPLTLLKWVVQIRTKPITGWQTRCESRRSVMTPVAGDDRVWPGQQRRHFSHLGGLACCTEYRHYTKFCWTIQGWRHGSFRSRIQVSTRHCCVYLLGQVIYTSERHNLVTVGETPKLWTDTSRDALAPYPWSRSASRCLAEDYWNADQRRPVGHVVGTSLEEGFYFLHT